MLRTSLLRKGYYPYKNISNGSFTEVYLAYHFASHETRVVKYPKPRIVGVKCSWGCTDMNLTTKIKHVKRHIEVGEKLRGVQCIPEQLETFEILFPILPKLLDLLTYNPIKDSSMCAGNLSDRYEWFSDRYAEFFKIWKLPVVINRYIRGTPVDFRNNLDSPTKEMLNSCLRQANERHVSLSDLDKPGNVILEQSTRIPYLVDLGCSTLIE